MESKSGRPDYQLHCLDQYRHSHLDSWIQKGISNNARELERKKWMNRLKHEFIADSDACNTVRAVRVDRGHNRLFLLLVFGAIVRRYWVVTQIDLQVHFRLLDRLKLRTTECLIGYKHFNRSSPRAPTGCNRTHRDGGAVINIRKFLKQSKMRKAATHSSKLRNQLSKCQHPASG
jgi:hypothetical protein